jgi:hypothetical protein
VLVLRTNNPQQTHFHARTHGYANFLYGAGRYIIRVGRSGQGQNELPNVSSELAQPHPGSSDLHAESSEIVVDRGLTIIFWGLDIYTPSPPSFLLLLPPTNKTPP